jgi:alpha-D-xyloside xylohydrolase
VRVAPGDLPEEKLPQTMALDALNLQLREQYFGRGDGGDAPHNDALLVTTPQGKTLLHMRTWTMAPESESVAQGDADAGAKGYRVASTFDSPADEHYYGLGQQQKGWMDLRNHEIPCWHDYYAIGGQDVCVPFMVSSRGYGLVWDNPSKTTVDLGFSGRNVWTSEVGNRVSYFVIVGERSDEIYQGYRLLTGVTHMLPRAIYGYIQSKAIYATQEQLLDVAREYRRKNLPLDVLVVDFLNMSRQGEMDLAPKRWPDPAAMNRELHAMGVGTLLSVWPHYAQGTQFYDMLLTKGWLIHTPDGKPVQEEAAIGPNIDLTNPEAAKWFWRRSATGT